MSERSMDLSVLGRIFIAALFLMTGLNKVLHVEPTLGYMRSNGLTFATSFLLVAAVAVELTGSILLLLGYRTRIAATALLLFLIPTTLVFHDFWTLSGVEMQAQMVHFLKNLAIMGGLAYVAAFGAPEFSIDARRRARSARRTEGSAATHHDPVHGF